jgi:hypothetical protein
VRWHRLAVIFVLVALVNVHLCDLCAQESTMVGDPTYEAVLNRLFPPVGQGKVPRNARNIVLKYGSAFMYTEMQILVYGQGSAEERYEAWWVPDGAPSIFQQVIDLRSRLKTEDPDTLASSIRIEHRIIDHPNEKLLKTAKQLAELSFSPSHDEGFVLDGIYYSFYFKSSSNHTRIEFIGSTASFSNHPLIKWMAAMRSAVEAQLNISNAEPQSNSSAPK